MTELIDVPDGGFSFLRGGLAYSQGVVASQGFAIEHVRFRKPVPAEQGFKRIAQILQDRSRPLSALCAVELRSPKPLPLNDFKSFNEAYAGVLKDWGLVQEGINAVARSNVAPVVDAPREPSFFAFSHTVAVASPAGRTFVVAGSSEWPEGGRFPEDVVRYGETDAAALREKARYVRQAMERRMQALGVGWANATATQSYCAYDVFDFLAQEIFPRGAAPAGVVCHYCRPPVIGWDYEMDVRGVRVSRVLE